MEIETRIIVLEEGQNLDTVVRRLEKGWVVRFKRGSSLLGKEVSVRTTLTGTEPLRWSPGNDHLAVFCEIVCSRAGSFKYTFSVDSSSETSGSGYFLVMPQLSINGNPLPLDGITCQTHLVKLLGDLSSWKNRLRVTKESGYNMIHLTPIHELGISNSSYSLSDHHALMDSIHKDGKKYTFDDVQNLVNEIEKEWGIITVQDVVWNHAAKNSKWLLENPNSSYNCYNSPHLRPAYVVDRCYHQFGKEVGEGVWTDRGVPPVVDNIHHISNIEYLLRAEVLPKIQLHEFFQADVAALAAHFSDLVNAAGGPVEAPLDQELVLEVDPEWRRFGRTVDMKTALRVFNRHREGSWSEEHRREQCVNLFREHVEYLNGKAGADSWEIIMSGLNSVMGHIRYERTADHGPKRGRVDPENPLTTDYFLHLESSNGWKDEEKLAYDSEKSKFLMAFNGWIMSSNPLVNFALSDSQVYLRRELVCWGDSVKLNYGEKEEDSPFLWEFMKTYTQKCAKIFHGLRIDNAHGTPIHVAEKLLLAAREVKPDLYVFAELFTGSEQLDNLFVNRLGISSLIREAQSAHDSHEQGRLVYKYGGDCVGAMIPKKTRLAPESIAHGLFLDLSHDNPSPILTRSVYDLLPTAAMVTMASCAVGSNRGYDELIRHHIHVVTEKRLYSNWEREEEVSLKKGMISARKVLNNLHSWLAQNGYTQVFVDQMNTDIVGITRHNPKTHETVVLVAHTAFDKNKFVDSPHGLKHIPIGGVLENVLFEINLNVTVPEWEPEDLEVLIGLSNYEVKIREHVPPEEGSMFRLHGGPMGYIELTAFPTGSVVAFKIKLSDEASGAADQINQLVEGENNDLEKEFKFLLQDLNFQQFNHLLFSCEAEDYAVIGQGGYEVPNFGKFVYCGIQGMIPVLDKIRENNDLGHPLCQNLRDGTWLCDYIVQRIAKFAGLEMISTFFDTVLGPLRDIPYYLRPSYFEAVVSFLYRSVRSVLLDKLSTRMLNSNTLLRWLTTSTVAFTGDQKEDVRRRWRLDFPHFAVGIWRNWGRDTFIALPGCLLHTGRFEDAKNIIVSFAGSMRHGLIPNLLAEGIGARFNCRDAVWFWLLSIVRYVEMAPEGKNILKATVRRIYPSDDTIFGEDEREEPLLDTVLEALDRHFDGISYRERNAGSSIDEHMKDEGFNIDVHVCKETGFVLGGNRWNCGTWMDKMGSSEKAGNRGEPATPRDGAAVEIQALAYRVLQALASWAGDGTISRKSVKNDSSWTWEHWASKIKENFEKEFFVEADEEGEFINRRSIVKDSVGSTLKFTDYQLRCNFAIALATAPDLIDESKAWAALDTAKALLGPIGIKTLDPSDWAYNGNYNNDDDGTNKATAKGWNYHQGPEWVWVAAFYSTARLAIGERLGGERLQAAIKEVQSRLGACHQHITNSVWRSLPELTNEGGADCHHSCPAQAWSVGCFIETCQKLGDLTNN
ncbi:unnamed protein product [Caenorhabditis auriculariae]|uniref:Glycogen debranching enzyme n=1 Tax=Caenorhabditis auriculariae TaxID=2777116 RepID=A0A8S1H9Q4_9PELO|nr:unnamed protein product [Caenorhabditis auriculariae]